MSSAPLSKGASSAGDKDAQPGLSSPAELMEFVDTLLAGLEDKFKESSSDVLERMTTMSNRIDSLEAAISDILHGSITTPALPASTSGGSVTPST